MTRHLKTVSETGRLSKRPCRVDKTDSPYLLNVAEKAYLAKARADRWATKRWQQNSSYKTAMKSLNKLENEKLSVAVRCREGDRAALKFFEAELNLLETLKVRKKVAVKTKVRKKVAVKTKVRKKVAV